MSKLEWNIYLTSNQKYNKISTDLSHGQQNSKMTTKLFLMAMRPLTHHTLSKVFETWSYATSCLFPRTLNALFHSKTS